VGEESGATAAGLESAERQTRQAAAARTVQGDSFVQDLVSMFDAKIVASNPKAGDKPH